MAMKQKKPVNNPDSSEHKQQKKKFACLPW